MPLRLGEPWAKAAALRRSGVPAEDAVGRAVSVPGVAGVVQGAAGEVPAQDQRDGAVLGNGADDDEGGGGGASDEDQRVSEGEAGEAQVLPGSGAGPLHDGDAGGGELVPLPGEHPQGEAYP